MAVVPALDGGVQRVNVDGRADQACLSDAQLRALARLGEQSERHFGTPQDVEFAIDADGALWLTQARPITTLFPSPMAAAHVSTFSASMRLSTRSAAAGPRYGPTEPWHIERRTASTHVRYVWRWWCSDW